MREVGLMAGQLLGASSWLISNRCTAGLIPLALPLRLPRADCQNAVLSMGELGVAADVFCRCGAAFCFNCREEAHRPVDCGTVRKWMVRRRQAAALDRAKAARCCMQAAWWLLLIQSCAHLAAAAFPACRSRTARRART